MAGYSDADAMRLAVGAGLPILRWSRFETFADVLGNVRTIGAAVGADARAAAVAEEAEAKLAALAVRLAGVARVRVLYLDLPNFTAGRDTLIDEMLTRAGGLNVAAAAGIAGAGQIAVESALALDAEAIVVAMAPGGRPPLESCARRRSGARCRPCGPGASSRSLRRCPATSRSARSTRPPPSRASFIQNAGAEAGAERAGQAAQLPGS